jgi:uncharacterized membrane protein
MATVSLVSGIVSVVCLLCCCIPIVSMITMFLGPIAGLVAVVTGFLGFQEAQKTGVGKNESIVGMALGAVGVLAGIVMVVLMLIYGGAIAWGAMQQPSY